MCVQQAVKGRAHWNDHLTFSHVMVLLVCFVLRDGETVPVNQILPVHFSVLWAPKSNSIHLRQKSQRLISQTNKTKTICVDREHNVAAMTRAEGPCEAYSARLQREPDLCFQTSLSDRIMAGSLSGSRSALVSSCCQHKLNTWKIEMFVSL